MNLATSDPLVLLVTDIPDQASSYVAALRRGGYRVHHASAGKDALGIVRPLQPDCAVIDLRLPDMTGWDLCRTLRADEHCDELRIVVLAPEVSRTIAHVGVEAGCHAWLAHPAVAEDLVRTVRHVLTFAAGEPASAEEAVLVTPCPACGSVRVRATLRVSPIQYYRCRDCAFSWRVDVATAAPL
jgi:CheY-like chemotaxis protein